METEKIKRKKIKIKYQWWKKKNIKDNILLYKLKFYIGRKIFI